MFRSLAFRMTRLPLAASLLVAACSSSGDATSTPTTTAQQTTFGGARPVEIRVPSGYDPARPAPLLLVLHGYSAGGVFNDIYMRMTTIMDAKGFFYVSPDGTRDSSGKNFWNATDGCCDFDHTNVDDVGYLTSLVREIQGVYAIDPKRIYVLGHSNGGYMANRLACEHADLFAAAVSWAGANWSDPARCTPSAPIGYLQIHGTKDGSVPFDKAGASSTINANVAYPGAAGTVAIWAEKNGCGAALTPTGANLRVNADTKAGTDTAALRHDGCRDNGAAELWPVTDAGHIFTFTDDAVNAIWQFMDAHSKR